MTATATSAAAQTLGSSRASSRHAFGALLRRDLRVLGKDKWMFLGRTIMQPLLLIFVFTYVFPKIGEAIGSRPSSFATLLVGGTIASAMIFQGVQAVALPLVQDFGYTREIEDRVLAPMPVWAVAAEKVAGGAIQALLEEGLAGKVLVTGQDAELVACQRIVAGTQAMTIYKPIEKLAGLAIEDAVRLAKRRAVVAAKAVGNGKFEVPAVLVDSVAVTRENLDDTVIRDGFHSHREIYGPGPLRKAQGGSR